MFTYKQAKCLINEIGRFTIISAYDHYGLTVLSTGSREYAIGTDKECQDAWDAQLEGYIDNCVLDKIPAEYRGYFDRDKFAQDASYDGRGHSLASYDGDEIECGALYLYRIQ